MVNVPLDNRHYLAFYILKIGQIQPTYISQEAKTSSFTFDKLIDIVFRPILSPQSEPSLFHGKNAKNTALFAFYINNIFETFKTY